MKTKKGLKSLISIALMVCLLASSMSVVTFAAAVTDGIKMYTDFSTQTKGGYDKGNLYTAALQTAAPGIKYDAVQGKFGKNSNDYSLYFHTVDGAVGAAGTSGNYLQFKNLTKAATANSNGTAHISMQLAFDNFDTKKIIYSPVCGDSYRPLIEIGTNGVMSLKARSDGTAPSETLTLLPNKWYKFDIIFNVNIATNGTPVKNASVYVDGNLVGNKYLFGYGDYKYTTLVRLENCLELKGDETGNYKNSGLYIDNFYCVNYDTGAEGEVTATPELYTEPTCVSAYYENGKYYVNDLSGISPAALLENINTAVTGWSADYTDISGGSIDVTSMQNLTDLNGKHLRLNKDSSYEEIYVPIATETQTVYNSMVTEPKSPEKNDNNNVFVARTKLEDLASQKTALAYSYDDTLSLGGKEGTCLAIVSDADKEATYENEQTAQPIVSLNFAKAETPMSGLRPFTIEMSVFYSGEIRNLSFALFSGAQGKTQFYPAYISGRGQVLVFDPATGRPEKILAGVSAKPNEWNKLAFTFYPNTRKYDMYLNGEKIVDGSSITNDNTEWTTCASFRMTAICDTSATNKAVDAIAAVDDITMYSGVADAATAATLENARFGNRVDIGTEVDDLKATNNGEVAAYTNNSFATRLELTDALTKNSVVVVTSEDGEILKYYYALDVEVAPKIIYDEGTGKLTATVTPVAPLTNTDDVVLILALYNNGVLEKVDVSDTTVKVNSGDELTAEITGVADMTGKTARAYAWKSLSTLVPWNTTFAEYPAAE